MRGAVGNGVAGVDDRRQLLVFDGDQLGGVLRRERRFGDDHGDRLADMHHPLARERRPNRHDQFLAGTADDRRLAADTADALHIVSGEHADHAGRRPRRLGIDARDAGEGVRRAHEMGKNLVRQRHIGDVAAAPADQSVVFDARVIRCVVI